MKKVTSKEQDRRDTIKLVVVASILSFLLGCAVMYVAITPKSTEDHDHVWEKCYCYDSFGRMLGYGSHCTVHGDGHECY